jgi:TPR repeat protein
VSKVNVHELPLPKDERFESAVHALREGRAAEALREAKALIDAGYPHAYTLAAAACEKGGVGLEADLSSAVFYYRKAVDEVGALEAWLSLGRMYYFGIGVEQDYEKALYYYSTVYEETRGGIAAMMLGRMYLGGRGVPQDLGRAERYLREAVAQGFALASTDLAAVYLRQRRPIQSVMYWLQGIWRAVRLPRGDTRLRPY